MTKLIFETTIHPQALPLVSIRFGFGINDQTVGSKDQGPFHSRNIISFKKE